MNAEQMVSRLTEPMEEVFDDVLLRLERLTARRADRIVRRVGEDDRSVWERAEAEVLGRELSPDGAG